MRPLRASESIQGANKSLLDDPAQSVVSGSLSDSDHSDADSFAKDSSVGWCSQWRSLSYNIRAILLFNLLWGASTSIWNFQLLAAYIFKVSGGSTETLGFIEAMQGGAYLLAAIVAGILTDKHRDSRLSIMRFTAILGLAVVVPLGVVALLCVNAKYSDSAAPALVQLGYKAVFFAWLFSYGVCASFCRTVIGTLFADIIPKGRRDLLFSLRSFVQRCARTLGPRVGRRPDEGGAARGTRSVDAAAGDAAVRL